MAPSMATQKKRKLTTAPAITFSFQSCSMSADSILAISAGGPTSTRSTSPRPIVTLSPAHVRIAISNGPSGPADGRCTTNGGEAYIVGRSVMPSCVPVPAIHIYGKLTDGMSAGDKQIQPRRRIPKPRRLLRIELQPVPAITLVRVDALFGQRLVRADRRPGGIVEVHIGRSRVVSHLKSPWTVQLNRVVVADNDGVRAVRALSRQRSCEPMAESRAASENIANKRFNRAALPANFMRYPNCICAQTFVDCWVPRSESQVHTSAHCASFAPGSVL